MSNFLRDYLEKRREEVNSAEDSTETAELLASLNSNIKLVANSTEANRKTSTQILGSIGSKTATDTQKDAVYGKFSKEQIAVFHEFAANQNSQTKTISNDLRDLNKALVDTLGSKLDEIAHYLKPDGTHSKRDAEAKNAARSMGWKDKPSKEGGGGSIIDDIKDVWDWGKEKWDNRKGGKGGKGGKGKMGKAGRMGKAMGQARVPSVGGGGSWWDAVKGKVGGAGESIAEGAGNIAGKAGGALKGLFGKMPAVVKAGGNLLGKVAAPLGAALDVGSGVSDLLDGKKQTEMPSGWDMISPMRWGMYAGDKINNGINATSTALGGSGSLGGDIYDGVDAVQRGASSLYHGAVDNTSKAMTSVSDMGGSIAAGFKNSVIPGFKSVTDNFGKFTDNFETNTVSMLTGLSKTFSDFGDNFKAGAGAIFQGAKSAVGSVGTAVGNKVEDVKQGYKEGGIAGAIKSAVGVGNQRQFKDDAGNTETREGGSRAWRNNNEGNMRYGDYAKSKGAIGQDKDGFAIFPDQQSGAKAKESLLFESKNYKDKSIDDAISRYAPSTENDTAAYQKKVREAAGVDGKTKMSDLTPDQRQKVLAAMKQQEGFKEGKTAYTDASGKDITKDQMKVAVSAQHGVTDKDATKDAKAVGQPETGKTQVAKAVGQPETGKTQVAKADTDATKQKPVSKTDNVSDKVVKSGAKPTPATDEDMRLANEANHIEVSKKQAAIAKTDASIMSVKKESPRMVDKSAPEEAKPVKVANAEQLKPDAPTVSEADKTPSQGGSSTVPTLDSLPLQLTDMGLVLLNIGHI
jgi:hypothetical protein